MSARGKSVHDRVDGGQVAAVAVVVQTVAHDKVVRDFEAGVVDVKRHLEVLGLDEQGRDVQ